MCTLQIGITNFAWSLPLAILGRGAQRFQPVWMSKKQPYLTLLFVYTIQDTGLMKIFA